MSTSIRFYANHLPSMSDIRELSNISENIAAYLESLAFSALNR
jgi:hypothetical protein